jgi:hypothetical protein
MVFQRAPSECSLLIARRQPTAFRNNTQRYDSNDGHRFAPPRNPVIAPKVPWLWKKENTDEDDLGRRSN